ncbi:MAG: hypothetical protein IPM54_11470 [Polyangiaceae bacterium]|nr:hypothetical protein [Polyangiaceae bacterium]
MRQRMRTIAAIGFWGIASIGLTPLGCASRLGPVRATQTKGGIDRPELQDITVAKASDCVAEYGRQLEPGYHKFDTNVQVNEDGGNEDVTIDDIPNTAYDLGACMRNVFRNMPIAEEPLRQGVETLKYRREQASAAQRSHMSAPIVIVVAGVTILVSELVIEAGAYTIVFAVTVTVADKAKDDVVEAVKRWRRKPTLSRCLDAAAGGGALWEDLCNAMTNSVDAAECWDKNLRSEQMKRNWCFAKFGN